MARNEKVMNYRCELDMNGSYIFKGLSQLYHELVVHAWTHTSHIKGNRHNNWAFYW